VPPSPTLRKNAEDGGLGDRFTDGAADRLHRIFSMSGSTRPGTPGSTGAARHRAAPVVAYRRVKTVGTHPPKLSGLNTFKVGFTRYLCTSPAFVPTHRRAGYPPRRKARYGARGSRLPRRDSHPLEHAALPGRTVPFFTTPFYTFLFSRRFRWVADWIWLNRTLAGRQVRGEQWLLTCRRVLDGLGCL